MPKHPKKCYYVQTMKNKLKTLATKRNIIILIVILLLLGIFLFSRGGGNDANDTYTLKKADFEKHITLSGKVVAAQSVDLSFETSGVVAGVYKNVGEKVYKGTVLAALDSGELQASREKARADLLAAEAELNKLKSSSVNNLTDNTEVLNNKRAVVDAIVDAYTKADDAVRSKVDQYFKNPESVMPEIKYSFEDYFDRKSLINPARIVVEETLVKWKALVDKLTTENYSVDVLIDSRKYIYIVKDFLDLLSPAVNSFEVSSELTQTTIDKYKTDLYSARTNINSAISDMTSADEKLRVSLSDIPVQEAKVKAAQANVSGYDAQIRETLIIAPFAGIVSLQDAKVGQAVSASTKVAGMISENYEIELYVPEINIVGIKLGNKGTVTLDANPNKSFEATVTHIDPAETLKDGVANYKVKLAFVGNDPLIRSGMTADASVVTDSRSGVLSIPERATVNEEGKIYVWKKVTGEKNPAKTEINIGEKDGKGNVEVVSGLSEEDIILLTPVTE